MLAFERKIYDRPREPFTTNIPASKSPSAMKEWEIKGGKCSHWDLKKAQARTPTWEIRSIMNSFHFPKGSNSCRAAADRGGEK